MILTTRGYILSCSVTAARSSPARTDCSSASTVGGEPRSTGSREWKEGPAGMVSNGEHRRNDRRNGGRLHPSSGGSFVNRCARRFFQPLAASNLAAGNPQHTAKPDDIVSIGRMNAVAIRGSQIDLSESEPGGPSKRQVFLFRVVPVFGPLPDVPAHVIQAVFIRGKTPHR